MSNKKLVEVQLQVKEIQTVMHNNIEKAIQRGDSLDVMNDKAVLLHEDAKLFNKNSNQLSSKMCWDAWKMRILLILILLAIIGIIIGVIYAAKN